MANSEVLIPIPGRLHSVATAGHVAGADEIYDDQLGKNQETLNSESAYLGDDEGQAVIPGFDPETDTVHTKAQVLTTAKKDAAVSNILDKGPSNGMGRVVLKADDDFKTVVESATGGNTIFVIRYDYTLTGDVTIPANCVLEFDGGSINGSYTLSGTETRISWNNIAIFGADISIEGTWIVDVISSKMFSDLSANNALKKVENLNNASIQSIVIIEKESYNYKFLSTDDVEALIETKSNTHYIINGVIEMLKTTRELLSYKVIRVQHGIGINVYYSKNVTISGLSIHGALSDAIYLGSNATGYDHSRNISISDCKLYDCGRQGLSICDGIDVKISRCNIFNIDVNADPGYAIDIEPNSGNDAINNIVISDNIINNAKGIMISRNNDSFVDGKNVTLSNNIVSEYTGYGLRVGYIVSGLRVINNKFIWDDTAKTGEILITPPTTNDSPDRLDHIVANNTFIGKVRIECTVTNCFVYTTSFTFKGSLVGGCLIKLIPGSGNIVLNRTETKSVCTFKNNIVIVTNKDYSGNTVSSTSESVFTVNTQKVCIQGNTIKFDTDAEQLITKGLIYPGESEIIVDSNDYPITVKTNGWGTALPNRINESNYLGSPCVGSTLPSFITGDHIGFEFFDTSNNTIKHWTGSAWV